MTEKLKCPFCNTELVGSEDAYGNVSDVWLECPNDDSCEHAYDAMRYDIWRDLIAGNRAKRQLRTVKDRCVKKIKAKEREIQSCLNGIHIRGCKIETLQEQLKQAQDALKEIARHDINEQRGELKSYVIGYQEIKELAIAAITEQEE